MIRRLAILLMLPYLLSIVALVVMSRRGVGIKFNRRRARPTKFRSSGP